MAEQKPTCLVCGRTSAEIPMLAITFQDQQYWICPQDFPILIHEPAKLAGKLPGVERLEPHSH